LDNIIKCLRIIINKCQKTYKILRIKRQRILKIKKMIPKNIKSNLNK